MRRPNCERRRTHVFRVNWYTIICRWFRFAWNLMKCEIVRTILFFVFCFWSTYHELFGLRLILYCGRENVGGFNVNKINSKNDDAVYWHRMYSKMCCDWTLNRGYGYVLLFFYSAAWRILGRRIDFADTILLAQINKQNFQFSLKLIYENVRYARSLLGSNSVGSQQTKTFQ